MPDDTLNRQNWRTAESPMAPKALAPQRFKANPFDPCLLALRPHLCTLIEPLLEHEDKMVNQMATIVLGLCYYGTGDEGYEILEPLMRKVMRWSEEAAIMGVALAYRGINPSKALELLQGRVRSRGEWTRCGAAMAIALLYQGASNREGAETLLQLLQDHRDDIRSVAAYGIGLIYQATGSKVAWDILQPLLKDPSPRVRLYTVSGVGLTFQGTGSEHIRAEIISLLKDNDPGVVARAKVALALIAQSSNGLKHLLTTTLGHLETQTRYHPQEALVRTQVIALYQEQSGQPGLGIYISRHGWVFGLPFYYFDPFHQDTTSAADENYLLSDLYDLLVTLRHLMQHEPSLVFAFCGAHRLQELIHDYWSVFFNAAIPRRVTFLSKQETKALITEPAAEYFAYDELAVDKIYRLTHGHPYFTQLLCHKLVNHVQRSPVVSSDVDAALRDLADTGNEHLEWIWAQSTPWEKTILWALTKLESQGVVILSDVAAFWRERGMTVDEVDLNQAIAQLAERELIRRDENRVAFTMGLIPTWIARCQSEQSVRQEVLK